MRQGRQQRDPHSGLKFGEEGKKKKKKKNLHEASKVPLTSCQEDRLIGLDYTVLCHG